MEWPFRDSVAMPAKWQYPSELTQDSPVSWICSELHFSLWCCFFLHSLHSQVQKSKDGDKSGITHCYPEWFTGKSSHILLFWWLSILVAEGEMLPPGETGMSSLKWKLRLPARHFGFLLSLNKQRIKGCYYTSWGDWSYYKEEFGILLHNGGKNMSGIWKIP